MSPHPVAGKRVLVTRAARDADRWATRLAALGAEPVVLPCLVCEPIADESTASLLRGALEVADWLLLSSTRGCDATAKLLRGSPVPRRLRIAAVGPATGAAAAKCLGRVDFVARGGTSADLGRELIEHLRHERSMFNARVVAAGAADGRDDAAAIIARAGIPVTRVAVYRTIPAPATASKRDLAAEGIEIVLLASPSAVTGLLGSATLPRAAQVITIGPTTSAAAAAAGLSITAEAARPTLEGILEAIV